jgi:hypothetical protein
MIGEDPVFKSSDLFNKAQMKSSISYKNCLIRGESFQREKHGTWIPQYSLVRHKTGSKGHDFPSYQYQFEEAFPTEGEADTYAQQKAKEWIDKN